MCMTLVVCPFKGQGPPPPPKDDLLRRDQGQRTVTLTAGPRGSHLGPWAIMERMMDLATNHVTEDKSRQCTLPRLGDGIGNVPQNLGSCKLPEA